MAVNALIYPRRFMWCAGLIIERIEKGYVNDPNDPGGETKYGISKRSYPDLDIPNITEMQAVDLYYRDYWQPCGCGALPRGLDLWVFDCAINSGPGTAVRLLQQVAGVGVDGKAGPQTIAAAGAIAEPEMFLVARLQAYQKDSGWARYQGGWTKRLFVISAEVGR